MTFALTLFIGILALLETGRFLGRRRSLKDTENARTGLGAIDGAIFGLMGLVIAFTFSSAASRFDARRNLIVQEANDVGTAWLRLDLLPPDSQPPIRNLFRNYLDIRLHAFDKLPDLDAVRAEFIRANQLQGEIWKHAVAACQTDAGRPATMLLLPALNAMFDTATSRNMAAEMHQPTLIFVMLGTLALVSALLAGHGMAAATSRSWIHNLGFALILASTIYVILDYEFPRVGFLRVDSFDQALQSVRDAMK